VYSQQWNRTTYDAAKPRRPSRPGTSRRMRTPLPLSSRLVGAAEPRVLLSGRLESTEIVQPLLRALCVPADADASTVAARYNPWQVHARNPFPRRDAEWHGAARGDWYAPSGRTVQRAADTALVPSGSSRAVCREGPAVGVGAVRYHRPYDARTPGREPKRPMSAEVRPRTGGPRISSNDRTRGGAPTTSPRRLTVDMPLGRRSRPSGPG